MDLVWPTFLFLEPYIIVVLINYQSWYHPAFFSHLHFLSPQWPILHFHYDLQFAQCALRLNIAPKFSTFLCIGFHIILSTFSLNLFKQGFFLVSDNLFYTNWLLCSSLVVLALILCFISLMTRLTLIRIGLFKAAWYHYFFTENQQFSLYQEIQMYTGF